MRPGASTPLPRYESCDEECVRVGSSQGGKGRYQCKNIDCPNRFKKTYTRKSAARG